jgi:hypothetical protein
MQKNSAPEKVAAKRHQAEIDAMRSQYVLVYKVDGEQSVALAWRALPEIPYDLFCVRGLLFIMLGYGF